MSEKRLGLNEPAPQLNGFVIEKRLGSGTYASVYKATPKSGNSEPVAIKCIRKSSLNKVSTENLLREIKILKQIKHDHIVQLKDFQWDENYIYLIMEYCAGGDLSGFIKSRRTIPEKYVRRFVQQIACAMKHLHLKGIAHMDLKPQNILLTSVNNPSLKLADFGFAQYMRGDNVSQSLRGSPLYMAPEILKNKIYDSKVDLWSIGVILHEVIFGYAPFISNTLEELEQKIMDDSPIEIPTHIMLSETCKDLLKRLLQRNPTDRISFYEFFNHPFVDLDHMASPECLPKANELLNKAVRFDQRGDYLLAQKYYLQSIEYLIPAIQYENDQKKKQDIREKASKYLKRAEEIADLINPVKVVGQNQVRYIPDTMSYQSYQESTLPPLNKLNINDNSNELHKASTTPKTIAILHRANSTENQPRKSSFSSSPASYSPNSTQIPIVRQTSSNQAQETVPTSTLASSSASSIQSQSQFLTTSTASYTLSDLVNQTENNTAVNFAIRACIDADERLKKPGFDGQELCEQYQNAISTLLPYLKDLPKDDFSKALKQQISKWLTNAERLKAEQSQQRQDPALQEKKLEMLKARNSMKEDDDENSQYIKQCIIS